jgi:hypothetical protein
MRSWLLFALVLIPSIRSSADDWAWETLDGAGCYVHGNGPGYKQCRAWWDDHNSIVHQTITSCAGLCSPNALGVSTCNLQPDMEGYTTGPDIDEETPHVVPGDPGNVPRKRWLQCVKYTTCICELQENGSRFCIPGPVQPTFSSIGTYQGDLGGPVCQEEEEEGGD